MVALAEGVTITSPANGESVSGSVPLAINLGGRVNEAKIYVDGSWVASTPPNSLSWDSSGVLDGTHVISAKAFSHTGKYLGGQMLALRVDNSPHRKSTPTATATSTNTPTVAPTPAPTATVTPTATATVAPAATPTTTATPTPAPVVTITAPTTGSTVSGTVPITAQVSSAVVWIDYYVDGNYLASSPPYTYDWNSTTVPNGSHVLSVTAFGSSNTSIGTSAVNVTVSNSASTSPTATATATATSTVTASPTPTPAGYYGTLAPHAALPSGSQCASEITQTTWEPRPENDDPAYSSIPTASDLSSFYSQPVFSGSVPASDFATVDGNYTGNTDMMIRWGACKWGMDEDTMRAQAVNETHWNQAGEGDWRTTQSLCSRGAWNGWTGSGCDQSYGIFQVKVYDFNAWPMAHNSISFNVDLHGAYQRACMNGDISYLVGDVDPANGLVYPNNDTSEMFWGCIGQWYSGGWYDSGAQTYISHVQNYLSSKPWLGWPNAPTTNVDVLSPLSGTTVLGTVSVLSSSSGVSWFDLYIDGGYRSSSANYSWDTTSQTEDGTHVIGIDGFDSSGGVIGHNYVIVNVAN